MAGGPRGRRRLEAIGRDWRTFGHVHPLGDEHSITREGNMATFPLERALELCRQVPRDMVKASLHWGTAEDVAPRLVAEIEAGARHVVLCNYVGFLSRADAPAATAELAKLAGLLRGRFPELAVRAGVPADAGGRATR